MNYSVLIRTFNSEATLQRTIDALLSQTVPPSQFIIVDSGSTDQSLRLVPEGSIIHLYQGGEFNYSSALNQGIVYASTEYLLVISSHTSLENPEAMDYALRLLGAQRMIGAAYFCAEPGELQHRLIGNDNFSGFNGVWNTCGLYRTSLLKKRNFRPEVYSAEDQEWSRWLFESEKMSIARIAGGQMSYNNPRKYPLRKWLGEYLSVATFTKREVMSWNKIARVAFRTIRPGVSLRDRYFHFVLFFALISCRFSPPKMKAKYW